MLGQVYIATGNSDEAMKAYKKVLELNPNVPVAQNNLAWIYADSGQNLDEAIRLAEAAKKAAPKNIQILDTLGWAYYKKGEYQKALENIIAAVDAGAKEADVFYHLGLAYEAVGNKLKADEAYRKVRELNPNFDKLK
jgi:tetratricopeptide (TPR) repeat protein